TIGHSFTLGLAVLDLLRVPSTLVETLIPVTIILTCLYNLFKKNPEGKPLKDGATIPIDQNKNSNILGTTAAADEALFSRKLNLNYLFALFFGFIHGMGFSGYLKSLLMPGEEHQLLAQLLAFNLGLELGQLMIVALILAITFIVLNLLKVSQKRWTIGVSIITALIAIQLLLTG
ncbi:MAG: HupE/UreJ family protein, partial [Bacteroidota bacterium]